MIAQRTASRDLVSNRRDASVMAVTYYGHNAVAVNVIVNLKLAREPIPRKGTRRRKGWYIRGWKQRPTCARPPN